MHEDEKRNENDVTPKGAVEIDETDLDQAAGAASGWSQPAENVAYDWAKIGSDKADIKAFTPDPSIGLLSEPQKKI